MHDDVLQYNTKFPDWPVALNEDPSVPYDGQMAYAYAKRGQVLLCEQWTIKYPDVKFATCHPGYCFSGSK